MYCPDAQQNDGGNSEIRLDETMTWQSDMSILPPIHLYVMFDKPSS